MMAVWASSFATRAKLLASLLVAAPQVSTPTAILHTGSWCSGLVSMLLSLQICQVKKHPAISCFSPGMTSLVPCPMMGQWHYTGSGARMLEKDINGPYVVYSPISPGMYAWLLAQFNNMALCTSHLTSHLITYLNMHESINPLCMRSRPHP
jgi:hypothetical protein